MWQPLKNSGLTVLIVGREHNLDEVVACKRALKLSMPALADPERLIYSRYANKTIPRTFVIDKDGRVALSELGFSPEGFEHMKGVVGKLLGVSANAMIPASGKTASVVRSSTGVAPFASASPSKDSGQIAINSALMCIQQSKYDTAINELEGFLKKWPEHAQAHYLLAVCFTFKKSFDSAGKEYNLAIKYATDSKLRDLASIGLKRIGR